MNMSGRKYCPSAKKTLKSFVTALLLCGICTFTSPLVCEGSENQTVSAGVSSSQENVSLEITLGDAILMALQNNRALRVERLNSSITKTYEERESAVFDPVLSAGLSGSREQSTETSDTTGGLAEAELAITRFLPSGTEISAGITAYRDWSDLYSDRYATRFGLTVTQALLRGGGIDFNLANLRQAELDTLSSQHELRGFSEGLVAEVETAYWNYALAQRQMEIYRKSMDLAEQQLKETEERISVGKMAEIELAAARAEVALRREALINAQSDMEAIRLRLLRLINPSAGRFWKQQIILKNMPAVPEVKLDDVESHVAVAMRMRSDINQARLGIQRGDLELVKTKNGLLPKMDLFISLGKTGYAGSFGDSAQDIGEKSYDVAAGITFELPFGNRDAESSHRRAVLTRRQVEESLENLSQLAELDVRLAYIEINRASQQIAATSATRLLQEETLRAEIEKFRVGRSTALLVTRAQRDLVDSQISEVQAVVNYLNSLVDLFRLEGSLLERRGISTDYVQEGK